MLLLVLLGSDTSIFSSLKYFHENIMFCFLYNVQRPSAAEREIEQLTHRLASVTQNLNQAEKMQNAPDMEQAIDILKCSSLEVELASKEKEVILVPRRLKNSLVEARRL